MAKLLWSPATPGHIVYLIDLSGSMGKSSSMGKRIDYTIDVLHTVLRRIRNRCIKGGGKVSEKLSFTIIGYNYKAVEIWKNYSVLEMAKKSIAQERNNIPIFDKEKSIDEKGFKPEYQTCMRLAFEAAKKDIEEWLSKQQKSNILTPAPVVINITDGEPYEGDDKTWEQVSKETLQAAYDLMNIVTPDGKVRLFNIHHNPDIGRSAQVFPSIRPSHPVEQFLFDASSEMDEATLESAKSYGFSVSQGSHCVAYNEKDPSFLVKLIEFGSSEAPSNLKNSDGSYF